MSARPALSRPSCIPSPHVFQRFELQSSFGWWLCCFVLRTSLCGCHCCCRQRFFSVSQGLRLRIVPSCPAWLFLHLKLFKDFFFMSISICLYVHMCTTCILFLCISNKQMCFTCNILHVDFSSEMHFLRHQLQGPIVGWWCTVAGRLCWSRFPWVYQTLCLAGVWIKSPL